MNKLKVSGRKTKTTILTAQRRQMNQQRSTAKNTTGKRRRKDESAKAGEDEDKGRAGGRAFEELTKQTASLGGQV